MLTIINVDYAALRGNHVVMEQLAELEPARSLAQAVGVSMDGVDLTGHLDLWRGPFPIDAVAVAAVGVALAAAADLLAVRNSTQREVVMIDARHAAASFLSDGLVDPVGWTLPPVWDPIAGDYRVSDGWIRLHTNYRHHRLAALDALGFAAPDSADGDAIERTAVAAAVSQWRGSDLEAAVAHAGGVAGVQRDPSAWRTHAAGQAVIGEPLLASRRHDTAAAPLGPSVMPFEGVRVLDLTRVLAGPTATGFLAAWGADVLRIDPPGFVEVPAIVPVTTCGKRTAPLDLASTEGANQFRELVRNADVVVHGYRSDALRAIGLDPDEWHDLRPGLVVATLDAYGWTGPWATRRGFDSIVQHSTGITAIGQAAANSDVPVALPCQALDHGCGWLLAAAVASGLVERCTTGRGTTAATSLARYAAMVLDLPADVELDRPQPVIGDLGEYSATARTAWGPLRRLRWPGTIGDLEPMLGSSGPIGASSPIWR